MRGDSLYRTVTKGKLEGRRGRGRRRATLLGNLGGGRSYGELKRMAEDREGTKITCTCIQICDCVMPLS